MKTAITIALTLIGITAIAIGVKSMTKQTWDKTFPQNENVTVEKVKFKNRFGIELVGDLYMPKDKPAGASAAIAISGPFGANKEQASGLYAQELASRGFVTLAFDPSFTGESGGTVRNIASPEISVEDMSAAVDFLSNNKNVDANKIGVLGICGFGGFALSAAAIDTRIKATVTSTMYDMSRVNANGYFDSMTAADRQALKEKLNAQRTADFASGTYAVGDGLPQKITGNEPQYVQDYYDYYKTPRGYHVRSKNSNTDWTLTTALPFMNMPILSYIHEIRTPVLMIHGENAHSRYFSEDAFRQLTGDNKELLIIPDAVHVDLYDGGKNHDKIPFDKIETFFKTNLE